MTIFDSHCDTLSKIHDMHSNFYENDYHVDIKRIMDRYDRFIQTFAVFIEPVYSGEDAFIRADKMIDTFYKKIINSFDYIKLCTSYDDLSSIASKKDDLRFGAVLSIEGASCLNGDVNKVDYFFNRGVRMMSLTWNSINNLACGIVDSYDSSVPLKMKGISKLGAEFIRRMNKLGMVLDLSHLSEVGFYEACAITSKPLIVSHSNSRSICSHIRNLTDAQLDMLKNINGVVGINFYPVFLNNSGKANSDDIIKHIEHIAGRIGEDHIGLGTDFDGIDKTPADIHGVDELYVLFNKLLQLNYSESFINKLASQNYFRVFEANLVHGD